ncbi:GNAT family N-acetyltransferase [Hyalangium rubrum]|uniref:GNAT family N-acetyltransferase n=1 Tax=Hyalangium rubrum TaxID=3103134 RepID=A0ABU5GVC9_9BACT|nr:GNAT family N-acetyltransferase [Hyalangium sp. s54d21]MDY7225041.1 GNAT family N-acetyltransferase [Hyalangium sp. s54d21]
MAAPITFRALSEADLPLLHDWLSRPHVAEWWEPTPTFEEVREDYLPRLAPQDVRPLDARAGVVQYLAYEGDVPFAFVQAYRVMAHQHEGWWQDETDPCALGIDQFIGLPDRLGQGLGTRLLRAFLQFLFEDPRVTTVQTDPSPDNARAIACYRKVGFRDVGLVTTPDGPELLLRATRDSRA